MKNTTIKTILAFLLGTFLSLGAATEFASAETLTWQASIDETVQHNAELRAANGNLRASDYNAKGAFSSFLPQISASLGYSYGDSSNVSGSSGIPITTTGSDSSYSAGLSASHSLFNGWQDKAKLDQANANVDVAKTNLEITKAKISFDLKSAYAALHFAQESVNLQEEIIHRREENFRLVELRFESGRENKGSVLLSKAYLNQAHFDALQARDNIRVAQAQLAKVLGREQPANFEVFDVVPTSLPSPTTDLQTVALNTPTVRQAQAQQSSAEAGVVLGRGGFFPSVDLNGSLTRQDTDWFPDNERWSVGAILTIPLFNGGKTYFNTKNALATSEAVAATRFSVQSQTVADLQRNYAAYGQAVEKLSVDESFQLAAQSRAEIARSKYNNGLLSFEDWDLIENDLIARQKNLLQSQRDRIVAEASWEQTQGKGVLP